MTAIEESRADFEALVSTSPFEYSTDRYPDSAAFPGTYKSLRVDLAWHAWCASRKACVVENHYTAIDELSELRQQVESLLAANAELHGDYLVAMKERDENHRLFSAAISDLSKAIEMLGFDDESAGESIVDLIPCAIAKIKSEAVREAYRHVYDTVSLQFCNDEYSEGFGDAMDYVEAYANQIEGGE